MRIIAMAACMLLTCAGTGCSRPVQESFRLEAIEVAVLWVDGDGAEIDIYNAGPARIGVQLRTTSDGAATTIGSTIGANGTWSRTLESEAVMLIRNGDDGTAAANVDLAVHGGRRVEFTPPSIDTSRRP
ncbi:MAG: hypothetical protein ACYTGR_01990 [Planctomycetota bacterium]